MIDETRVYTLLEEFIDRLYYNCDRLDIAEYLTAKEWLKTGFETWLNNDNKKEESNDDE